MDKDKIKFFFLNPIYGILNLEVLEKLGSLLTRPKVIPFLAASITALLIVVL